MTLRRDGKVRSHWHLSSGASDFTMVSTRSGAQIYDIEAWNNSTGALAYLKIYDSSVMSSVQSTAGTPVASYLIPAAVSPATAAMGGYFHAQFAAGRDFDNGIAYSLVAGAADNSTVAVTAGAIGVNIGWEGT